MNVQCRRLGLVAGGEPHASDKLLLVVDLQVLVLEEHDAPLGDKSGEVFDEDIGVIGVQEAGELHGVVWEACANVGGVVVGLELSQAAEEVDRRCGHGARGVVGKGEEVGYKGEQGCHARVAPS